MRQLTRQVALPYDRQTIKQSSWQVTSLRYCDPIETNIPIEYGHSSLEGAAKIAQRSPFTFR